MLPQSDGRRGVEPLCAAYGPACREPSPPAWTGVISAPSASTRGFCRYPPSVRGPETRRSGPPLFQREHRGRSRTRGRTVAATRIISIIGRKNAGKTTLTVALASELARRGHRVMTIKHGHHPADADRHGSDTWRHFHEGRAERVLIASPDLRVLFERTPDELRPDWPGAAVHAGRGHRADRGVQATRRFPRSRCSAVVASSAALRSGGTNADRSGWPSSPTTSISRADCTVSVSRTRCGSSCSPTWRWDRSLLLDP